MKIRKVVCFLLALILLTALSGCGKTRSVACDGCGKQILVGAGSDITDEWILYCQTCETELFGEDGLVPAE